MKIEEALKLAKEQGKKVRPVSWNVYCYPVPWIIYGEGSEPSWRGDKLQFLIVSSTEDGKEKYRNELVIDHEEEFLGEWEEVK